VLDAETGQRGYIITADPSYLEPFNRAAPVVIGEIERLQAALAADAQVSVSSSGQPNTTSPSEAKRLQADRWRKRMRAAINCKSADEPNRQVVAFYCGA
jgi:CHASE3 domain sensor protein